MRYLVIERPIEPPGDRRRKQMTVELDERLLQALPSFGGGKAGDLLLALNHADRLDKSLGRGVAGEHEMQ